MIPPSALLNSLYDCDKAAAKTVTGTQVCKVEGQTEEQAGSKEAEKTASWDYLHDFGLSLVGHTVADGMKVTDI